MNRYSQGTFRRRLFKDRWKLRSKAGLSDFSNRGEKKPPNQTNHKIETKTFLGEGEGKQNETKLILRKND